MILILLQIQIVVNSLVLLEVLLLQRRENKGKETSRSALSFCLRPVLGRLSSSVVALTASYPHR